MKSNGAFAGGNMKDGATILRAHDLYLFRFVPGAAVAAERAADGGPRDKATPTRWSLAMGSMKLQFSIPANRFATVRKW